MADVRLYFRGSIAFGVCSWLHSCQSSKSRLEAGRAFGLKDLHGVGRELVVAGGAFVEADPILSEPPPTVKI